MHVICGHPQRGRSNGSIQEVRFTQRSDSSRVARCTPRRPGFELNGRVDSRSAQGVPGAIVRLLHAASIVAFVTADDSGHFSFRADTAGDYSVQVERIGYMSAMLGPV